MRFTFDNHSRSADKAREVVQPILGDNLKSVTAGTNITRVVVETTGNITGDQQNNIAKALAQLPVVAEAANTPAKKVEVPAVVEAPVIDEPEESEAPAPTRVVVVPGT